MHALQYGDITKIHARYFHLHGDNFHLFAPGFHQRNYYQAIFCPIFNDYIEPMIL